VAGLRAMACVAALAASSLPAASLAGSGPATYSDAVGDAAEAPDVETVTIAEVDSGRLAVSIRLAEPTELGRYGWVLLGIDTDRNQRSGGMHGSEAIVFVNGERAVLMRLGRGVTPIPARVSGREVAFTLELADLGVRSFDFAVATLRRHADAAPDHGVFAYPASLAHRAPPSRLPSSAKR
jgi:hypothetical protein